MSDEGTQPRILLVDDEPRVLEGLALTLRRRYAVETAVTGAAALEILGTRPGVAVIVSDMRMPAMDGAMFLSMARKIAPDAVRVVLTGQADLKVAVAAINDGEVFRFLIKPCPPPQLMAALDAAVAQHHVLATQQGAGDRTLRGALSALAELLSIANPAASGRADRVTRSVLDMAIALRMPERGSLEMAARLAHIGFLTLPPEVAERLHQGHMLSGEETDQVLKLPYVAEKIVVDLPGLDLARRILAACVRPVKRLAIGADEKSTFMMRASQMLRVAMDYDDLIARRQTPEAAIAQLRARNAFDPDVLEALAGGRPTGVAAEEEERLVLLSALRPGMIAAEDIRMATGALLVARGVEISTVFVERAKAFRPGTVKEPVRVIARPEAAGGTEPARPVPPEVSL